MSYDTLQGELVKLERIKRKRWHEVLERFQEPNLYESAGLKKVPEKQGSLRT